MSLAILKKHYSEGNHPDIAKAYLNLGELYFLQGLTEKAIEHYKRSREIFAANYGEDYNYVILLDEQIENLQKAGE